MSENLDLVRSIFAAWERGDFSSVAWADPNIQYMLVGGPELDSWTGLSGMVASWRDWLSTWEDVLFEAEEYRELGDGRVLVLVHVTGGRGKTSGLELREVRTEGASLFELHNGKVTRFVNYWERDRALADLGLEE
jgi:ketosteroid isomerase-like protein